MRWVSLGFLFGVPSLVQAESCVSFQGFGSIRSTQPTGTVFFRTYAVAWIFVA